MTRPHAEPAKAGEHTLAALDVGSNAIRLQIVSVRPSGRVVELESLREPVRLGRRVFLTGLLEEAEIDRAAHALAAFRATMDRHGVERYRAVGTSAVREAQNRDLFLERVSNAAHIDLEAISGAEEARLLTVAVVRRVDLSKQRALLVDVGGGSVEITVVDRGRTVLSESHRVGAVRLAEFFLEGSRTLAEKGALLVEYFDRMLDGTLKQVAKLRPEVMLATGGNADSIARIVTGEPADVPADVSARQLDELTKRLVSLEPEERAKKFDLRPDRVDTIVPAASLLNFLLRRLDLPSMRAPRVGLRDGILIELIDRVAGRYDPAEAERGLVAEAERLGAHYGYDAAHAAKVRDLALVLFDALRPLHRLGARERRLLAVAATLHDVGAYVGYAQHHKHSHYLIANSEIGGLTSDELRVIAVAARYHRRAQPSERHEEYAGLSRPERKLVSHLSAILRLADGLDREHRQKVASLTATPRRGVLELRARVRGDFALERWALEGKSSLFREVFGLQVKLDVAAGGAVNGSVRGGRAAASARLPQGARP